MSGPKSTSRCHLLFLVLLHFFFLGSNRKSTWHRPKVQPSPHSQAPFDCHSHVRYIHIYYRIAMCLYCSICLLLQFILESQKCAPSRSDCQCAPSTARCSSSSLSPLWSSLSPPISSLISSCPSPPISPQSLPPSGAVAYFPPWMSVCAIYSVHRITGSWINYNRTQ